MADLSPAAHAVLDAFQANWTDDPLQQDQHCLAAAIRAAVVQTQHPGSKHYRGFDNWQCDAGELLAIATELEGDSSQ